MSLIHAIKFRMWVAWKLPKWLVYYAAIRLMAHATSGKFDNTEVSTLTVTDALRRWESC